MRFNGGNADTTMQMCIALGDSGIGEVVDLIGQWSACVSAQDQWALTAFNTIYSVSQRSV